MDMDEFLRGIDAQIKLAELLGERTPGKPRDRRQQRIPVAVERRSGKDRRWVNQRLTDE